MAKIPKWRRNIVENFNRLSRAHKRYRRQTTDDTQTTDGRATAYSEREVNVSSHSLKRGLCWACRSDSCRPICNKYIVFGSRPSDHYFRSVCCFVCLFVCAEFFSAVFDPISIKLGHMLYVWV